MTGRHGRPGPLHPPHREGVAQSLVGQVVTSSQLRVHLVVLQNLVQKVNVARRQLKGLDLAQFVRRERRDYFTQRREGVVQGLCPLALPDVGDHALAVWVLKISRTRIGAGRKGSARGRRPILRTPFVPFRSSQSVDLDVFHWLGLAVVCRCCGSNRGNVILRMGARVPFTPGDPRRGHDNRTGVWRWSYRVLLAGNHPSLRVVLVRLLLLSHAWHVLSPLSFMWLSTLDSFSEYHYFSLYSSPLPLCFSCAALLSSVCLQELLLWRCLFLRGLVLCCSSSPTVPGVMLCYGWTCQAKQASNQQPSLRSPRSFLFHTCEKKKRWTILFDGVCEGERHRQTGRLSRPASLAACETTATWIWLFKGREPQNFQLPTHPSQWLVRRTLFGQLSLRQQEERTLSNWSDQRDEAETKVCRTANQSKQLWRLLS